MQKFWNLCIWGIFKKFIENANNEKTMPYCRLSILIQHTCLRTSAMSRPRPLLRVIPGWKQGTIQGCGSHREFRILFQAHLGCWQSSLLCRLWSPFPCWLSVRSCCQLLETSLGSWTHSLLCFQSWQENCPACPDESYVIILIRRIVPSFSQMSSTLREGSTQSIFGYYLENPFPPSPLPALSLSSSYPCFTDLLVKGVLVYLRYQDLQRLLVELKGS